MGINIEPETTQAVAEDEENSLYEQAYCKRIIAAATDEERITIINDIYEDGFSDGADSVEAEEELHG